MTILIILILIALIYLLFSTSFENFRKNPLSISGVLDEENNDDCNCGAHVPSDCGSIRQTGDGIDIDHGTPYELQVVSN